MKKNLSKKLFGLTLTAALALTTLTACGNDAGTAAPPQNTPGASHTASLTEGSAAVGTVLLSVNPEIEMDYDDLGRVVALTGRNADAQSLLASYTDYEGRLCAEVIGELVSEINDMGFFDATIDGNEKNIVLKLERGSAYPSDEFLNDLAAAVKNVIEADQIGSRPVTLDQDDYDDVYGDQGYINAAAAQSILAAQLDRNDIQFVEKEYDLEDGDYEVEFVLDGVKYEYEVDAYTGKVAEMDVDGLDDRYDDDQYDDGWDDRYDNGWDDQYDDRDDQYDDDWDDRYDDRDDQYDDDWDDQYDDRDDQYDDDWDDQYDDDRDDQYDDGWDDQYDDRDDQYDDDWDDQYDDGWDDQYDDGWDDQYDDDQDD